MGKLRAFWVDSKDLLESNTTYPLVLSVSNIWGIQPQVWAWNKDHLNINPKHIGHINLAVSGETGNLKEPIECTARYERGNKDFGNLRQVYPVVEVESGLPVRAGLTVHETRGSWSSWPPHDFERDRLIHPLAVPFEEHFAFMTDPKHGWGIQVIRGHEETELHLVSDEQIVSFDLSAHPVCAGPTFRFAYFWVFSAPAGYEKEF